MTTNETIKTITVYWDTTDRDNGGWAEWACDATFDEEI